MLIELASEISPSVKGDDQRLAVKRKSSDLTSTKKVNYFSEVNKVEYLGDLGIDRNRFGNEN
jgi:hypothetical protein